MVRVKIISVIWLYVALLAIAQPAVAVMLDDSAARSEAKTLAVTTMFGIDGTITKVLNNKAVIGLNNVDYQLTSAADSMGKIMKIWIETPTDAH